MRRRTVAASIAGDPSLDRNDRFRIATAPDQPRKTTAGSSTITRRTLSRLARMQIRTIATAGDRQELPGRVEGQLAPRRSSQPNSAASPTPEAVAEQADDRRLEQDHADDPQVGRAHRLERAELLEVLEREVVERLPGDRRADQEARATP